MSLEVGSEMKSQSPRPSLVAPWNPPSYIRPLAAAAANNTGTSTAGAHWRGGVTTDDYTDMTFNLGGDRTSPTTMLQHLCLMEGRYNNQTSTSSTSTTTSALPPTSPPGRAHQAEPKVVRADPQGRRRHSSETFSSSSTSSSSSTPPGGGGGGATVTTTHPTTGGGVTAANGGYGTDGQTTRWSSSASFDSVWMSVEGLGGDPHLSQPLRGGGFDSGLSPATSASSSSPGSGSSGSSGSSRACRAAPPGGAYQNGLNYIALELREDGSTATTVTSGSDTGSSTTPTLPDNANYASIDFSKSDRVSSTNKD